MAKTDLKSKTSDELETLLSNYKKEGMNLRFQKSMGLALVLLVDRLWPRKFSDSLIRLF